MSQTLSIRSKRLFGGPVSKSNSLLVMASFAHRRKTIVNSLKGLFGRERALAALNRAGIDPGIRGEKLDLSGFIGLAEALREVPDSD